MIISRWRACASHGLTPLLTTLMQKRPSLIIPLPVPGVVNDVVQGMYFPPSKLVLFRSSWPVSLGASTPGEPLVGGAFQSGAEPTTGAAAGVAGVAGFVAATPAGGVVDGPAAAGAAGDAQSTNSANESERAAQAKIARREA